MPRLRPPGASTSTPSCSADAPSDGAYGPHGPGQAAHPPGGPAVSRAHGWPEPLQLALFAAHGSDLVAAALGLDGFPGPDGPRQVQLQHRPGAGISALYELPPSARAG